MRIPRYQIPRYQIPRYRSQDESGDTNPEFFLAKARICNYQLPICEGCDSWLRPGFEVLGWVNTFKRPNVKAFRADFKGGWGWRRHPEIGRKSLIFWNSGGPPEVR